MNPPATAKLYRLKCTNPPKYLLDTGVKVCYLRIPCEKSLMWVADPNIATVWGHPGDIERLSLLRHLERSTWEIEEVTEKVVKPKPWPKPKTKSIYDDDDE